MEEKDKIISANVISIEDEMKNSYLDYAMSVIVSRALPDCRDGLKPVHRRILYAMNETGNYFDKPYRKSARVVGEVMGKYHPHGDAPIYSSLVRMAQDFSLRVPLIDGQGNFGSMDGDDPAHMRYTEVRLAKVSNYLLLDIDKRTVDFQDNYDGSEKEPKVLPARFPNLLVNGANGIAVGMATNIPTHNLSEVIDSCCALIDNPDITSEELVEYIPGPDFPTGGEIVNAAKAKHALVTGRGVIIVRGKTKVEEIGNKEAIIITEVPYQVNKAEMIKTIERLAKEKIIDGIAEIRDETNKLGLRIVIEIKRDFIPDVILNLLYKHSQLQSSFGVNMLALNQGMPEVMSIRHIINTFIDFKKEVVKRRTAFLLGKAREKAHTLIGLAIAVSNIDEVIRIIKSSSDPGAAKLKLMEIAWEAKGILSLLELISDDRNKIVDNKCYFTEEQTKAILEMKLQRLTALEKDKVDTELKELSKIMQEYLELLNSHEKLMHLIKFELLNVKDLLGMPRRTILSDEQIDMTEKDFIISEDIVVTVTKEGYIKRNSLNEYKTQKRGGKGKAAMSTYDDDITTDVIVANTHNSILFFSSFGKVYQLDAYKIPLGSIKSKGRALVNLLPLEKEEKIMSITPLTEEILNSEKSYIIFATEKGNARRNSLLDFARIQSNGKIAIKLDDDDKLVTVLVCKEDDYMLFATRKGKAVCFSVSALRVFKSRSSSGVRAIKLSKEDDKVVSASKLNLQKISSDIRDEYLKIPLDMRFKIVKEIENAQKSLDFQTLKKDYTLENIDKDKIEELAKEEQFLLTITENGFGKRTSAYEYRVTNRGSQGVLNIKTSKRNGLVICTFPVDQNDEIMLITNNGTLIRTNVSDIRITGRNTLGVKIINLKSNKKVVSVSKINE